MKDDRLPLDPPDEEELRSAAALARALDGGRAEPDLPQAALEAAALLRFSAGAGKLDDERRAAIRRQLLEDLASAPGSALRSPSRPRLARWRWLLLAVPVAGAAAFALVIGVRSPEPMAKGEYGTVADQSSPNGLVARGGDERLASAPLAAPPPGIVHGPRADDAGGSARGPLAPIAPEARGALVELGKAVGARRADLLARAGAPALREAHARLDAARSRAEFERSERALRQALEAPSDGLDPNDARLLRQDLYCRLAETALRLGEPRTALEWARRGLDLDGPPTPFLAQLMALEGDAWAALGDRSSAAASYMKALGVQETLLDESLDGH